MPTGEVWRIVPSLKGVLVSSEGRVMTNPKLGSMPSGGRRHYEGAPYLGVWSKQDGRFIIVRKGKTYKVHRLVCEAFHGPPRGDAPFCLHVDENAANNRASNLKWGTQKENLNAKGFLAYCSSRTGESSPTIKGILAKKGANV